MNRDEKGNYLVKGKPYVSVTTVIGKFFGMTESLMNNYHCKLCKDYNIRKLENHNWELGYFGKEELNMGICHAQNDREGKAKYGTMGHRVFEDVLFHKLVVPTEFKNRVSKIKEVYDSVGLELIHPELTTCSHKLESAGTTDVIAISRKFSDVRLYIIDYKTGSAQKKKEAIQLGAYGKFVQEMIKSGDLVIPGLPDKFTVHGLVLHIGRDDDYKVKATFFSPQVMKLGAKAFDDLLKVYRYTKIRLA